MEREKTELNILWAIKYQSQILTSGAKKVSAAVKSTGCSYRGPTFDAQHPHGSSQTSVTPGPGDLIPSAVGACWWISLGAWWGHEDWGNGRWKKLRQRHRKDLGGLLVNTKQPRVLFVFLFSRTCFYTDSEQKAGWKAIELVSHLPALSLGESAGRLAVYRVSPASSQQFPFLPGCAFGWQSPPCVLVGNEFFPRGLY